MMLGRLVRRYNHWRTMQPSRVRYAMVPAGPRLTASGLKATVRIVEFQNPASF